MARTKSVSNPDVETNAASKKKTIVTMDEAGKVKGVTKVKPKAIVTLASVMAEFEPHVRTKIAEKLKEVDTLVNRIGVTSLEIGKRLAEVKSLAENNFEKLLKQVRGFSRATAYRYINAYEIAQKKLPAKVVAKALSAGIDIAGGNQADKPFGKFQDAIESLQKDNPDVLEEAGKSDGAAEKFLQDVKTLQRKLAVTSGDTPANYSKAKGETYQKNALAAFRREYAKVPQEKQSEWTKGLLSYILWSAQMDKATVQMHEPPKSVFEPKKLGRKKNTENGEEATEE